LVEHQLPKLRVVGSSPIVRFSQNPLVSPTQIILYTNALLTAFVNATTPFTWATSDQIEMSLTYEADDLSSGPRGANAPARPFGSG
jgi:hypothetical protein